MKYLFASIILIANSKLFPQQLLVRTTQNKKVDNEFK